MKISFVYDFFLASVNKSVEQFSCVMLSQRKEFGTYICYVFVSPSPIYYLLFICRHTLCFSCIFFFPPKGSICSRNLQIVYSTFLFIALKKNSLLLKCLFPFITFRCLESTAVLLFFLLLFLVLLFLVPMLLEVGWMNFCVHTVLDAYFALKKLLGTNLRADNIELPHKYLLHV